MTDFEIINFTRKYKDVIKYVDRAWVNTPETVKLKNVKTHVEYKVSLFIPFYYDRSNGALIDTIKIEKISTNNAGTTISNIDMEEIRYEILQHYIDDKFRK